MDDVRFVLVLYCSHYKSNHVSHNLYHIKSIILLFLINHLYIFLSLEMKMCWKCEIKYCFFDIGNVKLSIAFLILEMCWKCKIKYCFFDIGKVMEL